jgi:phosphosulfolactate phosphohydrolase-like enzyme
MTYTLRRTRDGAGDSGQMSLAIIPTIDMDTNKATDIEYVNDAEPRIGVVMRVGSHYARTFSHQDWWQTTLITEILEERTDPEDANYLYVRFKTGNSEYEWIRS